MSMQDSLRLHPHSIRNGLMPVVVDILRDNPEGLTYGQIGDLAVQRGLVGPESDREESSALYYRIKRAALGLEKLGYIQARQKTKEGILWTLNEERIEQDKEQVARELVPQLYKEFEERMFQAVPVGFDGAQLLAAFEGVLKKESVKLTMPAKPKVGQKAREIKKTKA